MKYLIVGGQGVLGEALVERLNTKENAEMVVATKVACADSDKVSDKNSHIKYINWSFQNEKCIFEKLEEIRPDVIFDLNVQDSVGQAWKNPNETVNVNVVETIALLNAVKDLDYKPRLVIGGSGEEYGHLGFDHLPLQESETPHPVNIFGATKACQTMFAKLYHRAYGMNVVVLRTFNETSPLQDDRWAISSFCKQFVKMERGEQEKIIHVGNTNIIRDFTDVDDLAHAFELVAEKGASGEVYNAARGVGVSIGDIIHHLEQITSITVDIRTDKSKVRPIDAPAIIADVRKIREDTGWEASVDIRTTLEKMVNRWRIA